MAADLVRLGRESLNLDLTDKEIRIARVRLALLHVGGANLSSAMSTVGSAVFLLFTTLTIFVKLGSVVMAVTVLSITFTLVALPAVLMIMGPPSRPWYARLATGMLDRCWDTVASALGLLPEEANPETAEPSQFSSWPGNAHTAEAKVPLLDVSASTGEEPVLSWS